MHPSCFCFLSFFCRHFFVVLKKNNSNDNPADPSTAPVNADVYVAGYKQNGAIPIAKLWKNHVPVTMGGPISYAKAIYVVKK